MLDEGSKNLIILKLFKDKLIKMGFCKAITSDGCPCTNVAESGRYCEEHDGDYDECPVCYEDMQCKSSLECGHTFCLFCLYKCEVMCPLCRAETNVFRNNQIDVLENIKEVMITQWATTDKANRIQLAHDICDQMMQNHIFSLTKKTMIDLFEKKLDELCEVGMNTDKLKKQLESFKERIKA